MEPQHQQSAPNWVHSVPYPYLKCLYGFTLQYIWVDDCYEFVVLPGDIHFLWPQEALASGTWPWLVHIVECFVYLHLKHSCSLHICQTCQLQARPIHRHHTPVITALLQILYTTFTALFLFGCALVNFLSPSKSLSSKQYLENSAGAEIWKQTAVSSWWNEIYPLWHCQLTKNLHIKYNSP